MKTKRILITLSLGYGINMMGFESSLTREQISVSNPELTVLSLREFCMLSKENLLRMDDMTPVVGRVFPSVGYVRCRTGSVFEPVL